jgi:hypothetical protein
MENQRDEKYGDVRDNRAKRIVDSRLEESKGIIHEIKKIRDDFSVEMEEFKDVRAALIESLNNLITEKFKELSPVLSKSIYQTVEDRFNQHTENLLKEMALKTDLHQKAVRTQEEVSNHLTFKMAFLTVISGVTCFVMAAALYFLFPKTENVHLNISNEQVQNMMMGEIVFDSHKELDPKDVELLKKKMKEKVEKFGKKKNY